MQPNGAQSKGLLASLRMDPIQFALGRPRTLLDVGGYVAGHDKLTNRRACRLTAVIAAGLGREAEYSARADEVLAVDAANGAPSPLDGRSFDLVVVEPESFGAAADAGRLVERFAPFVGREGHLIVIGGRASGLADLLGRFGLRLLREDADLLVARRPPAPGPVSLTVGMLTMNEEQSIEKMIVEIRRFAPDASILCVDSSTKDQTHVIAERMGARVLRQLPPRGHGPAMELLMYEAANQSDALIYLDCDFTYPAEAIPTIRRILESGVDVVNAARTRGRPEAMPLPNYLANRTFALTSMLLNGVPAADLHSGMRGYRSSAIRAFAFDGEGDALPIDTLLFPAKCGYSVAEIPIPYHDRVGASKLRKFAGTAWSFIRIGKAVAVGSRRNHGYEVRDAGG